MTLPRPKRVICIDDDETILKLNKQLLEATGNYRVSCFASGPEGISAIKSEKPDLLLLDMAMPGMDGIAVLKMLREDPTTRLLPVIFMTAHKTPADMKKYMDMGALSVIAKPIDIEDFPRQVEMLSQVILP